MRLRTISYSLSSVAVLSTLFACAGSDTEPERLETVDAVAGDGSAPLLQLDVDREEGRAYLTLPEPDEEGVHLTCLHIEGIETGLGANDVGLDRGAMSGARLVRFRTVGSRILLEELNTGFRAEAGSEDERRAAAQSFATSVLFGAEPESGNRRRIDITGFLVRDAHGIVRTLDSTGQGKYSLDQSRSALDLDRCRVFPDNADFAALLTFTSSSPGSEARRTAPNGAALSFVQRQGFVRLPDDDFERRPFDPRMGAFGISFLDYSAPLSQSVARRFAVRHRIERDARTGAPLPIVYYVDRAAPEPVRSALVEGASWWSDAFAAAGYPGLFRVEVAPEGLDPLDVRNNVIQWVHRSTRGWSYGNAISDPRTGEIIKGHVSLGSLRVRQDRLLFEGLLGDEATGTGRADDPIELSLARIRQLGAHEVGHTLGLSHNFAASVSDRASVMDYPAPRVRPDGAGGLDASDAYDVGIGEWDIHAIRMLYEEPEGDIATFYDERSADMRSRGIAYLTDQDSRSSGAAQPLANLWDDGLDPIGGLENALAVRRIALEEFDTDRLADGAALGTLEEVFVPVYLHHRYQVDAAVKMVGGLLFEHELVRGGGDARGARPVPMQDQGRALDVLMETLRPDTLRVPEEIARYLAPAPPGFGGSRERFEGRAGAAFDVRAAADVAARMTVRGLLHPERLLRVDMQHAQGAGPGITSVLERLTATVQEPGIDPLADVVANVVVEEALRTYRGGRTAPAVQQALRHWLESYAKSGEGVFVARAPGGDKMFVRTELRTMVQRELDRPAAPADRTPDRGPDAPPGSPIGSLLNAAGTLEPGCGG